MMAIVYTTLPDEGVASEICKQIVSERLAGCCNIFKIKSIYTWQGNIESGDEVGVIIKTKKSLYQRLKDRLKELHPYKVPPIILIDVAEINEAYWKWLNEVTLDEMER